MTTEQAIAAEYARIRKAHISKLRSLAQVMLQEAIALEGTNFVPASHWQSDVPRLTEQVTQMQTLAGYMKADA